MSTPIESQIKERIHAFVAELDVLVRRSTLDALRNVLDTRTAGRRGPGRPRGPARSANSTDVEGVAQAIAAHVRANDGQTVGEIAQAVGASPKAAKKAVAQLLASGQLKKTGQKRGTRYHAGSGRPATTSKRKRGKRRGRKKAA